MVDAIQNLVAEDEGPERPPEEAASFQYSPSVLNTPPQPDGDHDMNLGESAGSRRDAEVPAAAPPSVEHNIDAPPPEVHPPPPEVHPPPPEVHPPPPEVHPPHLADGRELAELPDDMPLEMLLPPGAREREVPGDGQAAPAVRGARAAPAMSLNWTDIQCEQCGQIAGQLKYNPGPGRNEKKDPPTWYMRVKDVGGSWPIQGPCFSRRLVRIVGDSDQFCRNWIRDHRNCCENA